MNDDFRPAARNVFDFLIDDFGFFFTEEPKLNDFHHSIYTSVRYDSASVFIEIYKEKGQISLLFTVKGDTPIIRPYMTHRFELSEVSSAGFLRWTSSITQNWKQATDDDYLRLLKKILLEDCAPILRDDIEFFEKMTAARNRRT
ncbi:MAG: hypothetical protein M3430_11070 [Acidobacteriota bacterium]|nr:hypothetical protein [Acidobacteriota bacterium]